MLIRVWKGGSVVGLAIGIVACGSSSSTTSISSTAIVSGGTSITNALTSSVGGAGISVSGSNLMDDPSSGVQHSVLDELIESKPVNRTMTWTAYDTECNPNQSGWPVGSSGALGNNLSWTGQFFYCLMREPTPGPDTVMGAFSQAMGWACALGNNLVFDGQAHSVTLTISSACFPAAFVSQMAGAGLTSVTLTATGSTSSFLGNTVGSSAWDGSLEVTGSITGQGTVDLYFLFANRNNVFTMVQMTGNSATNSAAASTAYQDGFMVSYDGTNGYLRYEGRFQRYNNTTSGQSGGWNRHVRALVKGTPGATGFSAVTSMQALWANTWNHAVFTSYTSDVAGIKSFSGSPSGGFYILNYETATSGANPATMSTYTSNVLAGCTGKAGLTCSGNTGIPFTTNTDALFAMPGTATSSQVSTNKAWFNALQPPTYTTVTTADTQ